MDNDELIRKLESTEVPDIQVETHRLKLREALIAASSVGGLEQEPTFWDRVKPYFDGFFILLQRPAWRFGLATAFVAVLALSVFEGWNITNNVSPTVLASDIALNDPELSGELQGTGEIRVLEVNITGGTAHVICGRDIGNIVQSEVDLKARKVVKTQHLNGVFVPELSDSSKSDAINIALTDSRVRQMVASGGNIKKVMPSFPSISGVSMSNDNVLKLVPGSDAAVVQVELDGKCWLIQTNLTDHRVEGIIEPQRTPVPVSLNVRSF